MKLLILFLIGPILVGCVTNQAARTKSPAIRPVFVANIMVGQEKLPLYQSVTPEATVQPIYPRFDRENNVEGDVTVGAVVGVHGRVSAVFIVDAKAPSDMQVAAMAAVRKWRFAPMLRDGIKIRYAAEIPIIFNIAPATGEMMGP